MIFPSPNGLSSSLFAALLLLAFYGSSIFVLVDAARRPDWQFDATDKSKTMWIVIPIVCLVCCSFGGVIAAIIWFASVRPQLQRARYPQYLWPPRPGGPPAPPTWPPSDAPPARWEVGGSVGDDERPPPSPPPSSSRLPPPPPPPLG